MQATGNRAPVTIKSKCRLFKSKSRLLKLVLHLEDKDKWIMLERERWAKYFNIPIAKEVPVPFPQPTINTQRALCYIQAKHPDKLIAAFDALYKAFWVERKTINDPQVISAALEGPLGKEVTAEVLEGLKGDEAKQVLRANSDQALNDGCFGLPYFVATNAKGEIEKYWGVDHMGMLMDHLGVEVPRKANGFQALL